MPTEIGKRTLSASQNVRRNSSPKFDLVCETNLKEKSGVIGARVRDQTGKANFWRRIGDLPGVYFAEFLGFATLRPLSEADILKGFPGLGNNTSEKEYLLRRKRFLWIALPGLLSSD